MGWKGERCCNGWLPPTAGPGVALPWFFGQNPLFWFVLGKKCFSAIQRDQCYDLSRVIGGGGLRYNLDPHIWHWGVIWLQWPIDSAVTCFVTRAKATTTTGDDVLSNQELFRCAVWISPLALLMTAWYVLDQQIALTPRWTCAWWARIN